MASSSAFWENYGGIGNTGGAIYSLSRNRDQIIMQIAHRLRAKGNRKVAALMSALNGAVAGGAASSTYRRPAEKTQFVDSELGGRRTIETRTIISRVTTAADKTQLDKLTGQVFRPASYPVDRSGNGGGGKSGTF